MDPSPVPVDRVLERGRSLLEQVVFEPDLSRVLDELCRQAQGLVPGTVASVLLLDEVGRLSFVGGPDVPLGLRELLDGLEPAPHQGSCGHAVYTGGVTIVSDVDQQPEFVFDARFVEEFGVRACWSFPIRSSEGQVLGSFALSSLTPRQPGADEMAVQETAAHLVGLAVERGRARAALEDQRELLRAIVESSEDPMFVKDLESRYVLVNRAEIRGICDDVSEMVGRTDEDFYSRDLAELNHRMDRHVFSTGESLQYVQEFENPVHGKRTYHIRKSPQRDADGNVVGLVGIARDITDMRRAEEALSRTHRLGNLGALASGMVREFRELLDGVRGQVDDLLERAGPDSPLREGLAAVRDEAARAMALSHEFLDQGREERAAPTRVDLRALVAELEGRLRALMPEDAELRLHLGDEPVRVWGQPDQLRQLVLGLVANAGESLCDGERRVEVLLQTRTEPQRGLTPDRAPDPVWARLLVRDTGCGIAPEALASIFDPRYSTKGGDRGLGLTVLRGIAQTHGGTLTATSQVGVGTTVLAELPAMPRERGAEEAAPEPGRPARSGRRSGTPRAPARVLLTEQDEGARRLLLDTLGDHGYEVDVALDADELLSALHPELHWHAIVLDEALAGAQADEVRRRLEEARFGLCVHTTGNGSPEDTDDADDLDGAPARATRLRKPYGLSELLDLLAGCDGTPDPRPRGPVA